MRFAPSDRYRSRAVKPGAGDQARPRVPLATILLVTLLLLAGCAGAPVPASPLAWQAPQQGLAGHVPVIALASDQGSPRTMLAATIIPSGLFRTQDGGLTWEPADAGLGGRQVFTLLAVARQPGSYLAGTADGLWRSDNWGQSWQAVPGLPEPMIVYALAGDAQGTLTLAGDRPQPYRSTDGGRTWQPLTSLPGTRAPGDDTYPSDVAILTLAVSQDGGLLLAGTDGAGLFVSRDGGHHWQPAAGVGETYVAGIWMVNGTGQGALARTRKGLFRSADSGHSWQQVAEEMDGARIDALMAAADGNTLLLASNDGRLHRSTDGLAWIPHSNGWDRRGTVFFLQAHPAPDLPDLLYAGTQAGLHRSLDGGLTWQQVDGPGRAPARDLAMTADGTLFLAGPAGVRRSDDMGVSWQPAGQGLPAVDVLAVAASQADPALLYAGTDGQGLFVSSDGGKQWSAVNLEVPMIPALHLDPEDSRHVWVVAAYARMYESKDGGNTWITPWEGLGLQTEITAMAGRMGPGQTLYAGSTDALFRRQAEGPWERIASGPAGQTAFAIAADGRRLAVAATKGLYISHDAGDTWQPWGEGLEGLTVTALAQHPQQEMLLYAGTRYAGVYRSQDGGRTWYLAGLEGTGIDDLIVSTDGRWLLAATSRGFYRAPVQ